MCFQPAFPLPLRNAQTFRFHFSPLLSPPQCHSFVQSSLPGCNEIFYGIFNGILSMWRNFILASFTFFPRRAIERNARKIKEAGTSYRNSQSPRFHRLVFFMDLASLYMDCPKSIRPLRITLILEYPIVKSRYGVVPENVGLSLDRLGNSKIYNIRILCTRILRRESADFSIGFYTYSLFNLYWFQLNLQYCCHYQ